jgi:hypothetical protein
MIQGEGRHDLAYYEAVPYLLVIESVEGKGEWLRRAEHPELPGCVARHPRPWRPSRSWSEYVFGCCASSGIAGLRFLSRARPCATSGLPAPSGT